MSGAIVYQSGRFKIGMAGADRLVTAYDWTHDRDGNVNPVLYARFAGEAGQFDAYAKPFCLADQAQATLMLNEATDWLMARACGLPTPPSAMFAVLTLAELPTYSGATPLPLADANGQVLAFVTQAVSNTAVRGIFPTDQLVKEQTDWLLCNATIAFDEALANPDRHAFNLLRQRAKDFVLIDHGFLLRDSPDNYPRHWADGQIEAMTDTRFPNLLHDNAYIFQGRTSPAVGLLARDECSQFIREADHRLRAELFEIAYWCSKLLPGKSARWLGFLYSRAQQAHLVPLLTRRFGLLPLHA